MDTIGEFLGQLQVGCAGLHPDEIRVRGVGLGARDTRLDPILNVVVALRGAVARNELLVPLVDVRGNERRGLGVGAGNDHGRRVQNICRQPCRRQRADVLLRGDQHLATQVATLLLRGQLVLPVGTGRAGLNHGFL